MGWIPIGGFFVWRIELVYYNKNNISSSWQGSNLRGQSPLRFKSNALATRPQLPTCDLCLKSRKHGMETRGIEPLAIHMQSKRSTTELHLLGYLISRTHNKWQNRAGAAAWHGMFLWRRTNPVATGRLEPPIFSLEEKISKSVKKKKKSSNFVERWTAVSQPFDNVLRWDFNHV